MRDPDRIWPVLATFGELWQRHPDWRFMQLICNIQAAMGTDGFYMEDDELRAWILKRVEEYGGIV